MKNKLILHAIICHKPYFRSKEEALDYAQYHFPHEHIKGFVRETGSSFRVRVVPKTQFIKTSYVTKVINPNASLVFGKLKK
jgi:hypothetical protein